MIRECTLDDVDTIYEIINDAAQAYKGVIPEDRWTEPYMPRRELLDQIDDGVTFWGHESDGQLNGIIGIQDKGEVRLIRHAYVRTRQRGSGIGSIILSHLLPTSPPPILVGTWKAAVWAIAFYQKSGFQLVSESEKNRLLKRYWNIPRRQIETSVVLADRYWFDECSC